MQEELWRRKESLVEMQGRAKASSLPCGQERKHKCRDPQAYTEDSKMIYEMDDQNERAEKTRARRRETAVIIDSKVTHLFDFRK